MRGLERLVNIEKVATKAVLDGLLLLEEQTTQKLEIKLNELKTEAALEVHNSITDALKDVNLSINKGREEGKNVDECYYSARNNLETKNTNANAELDTCVDNGRTAMEGPLANVATSIEAAEKLLTDLDAIIPNCYSRNFLKMQACVMKDLYLSRATLKRITGNAKEVGAAVAAAYGKMIITVRSCITKTTADVRTSSTNVVISTETCVRNAAENKPFQLIM